MIWLTSSWWPNAWPVAPVTEKPFGVFLRPMSKLPKKNALFFTIGPPRLKPPCWSLNRPTGVFCEASNVVSILPTRPWLRPK